MNYKVLRDCHYKNRYWNQGEIADFPDGTDNDHFELFDQMIDPEKVIQVPEEPRTMSEMNTRRTEAKPKTGMGYTLEEQQKANSDSAFSKKILNIHEVAQDAPKKRGRPAKV